MNRYKIEKVRKLAMEVIQLANDVEEEAKSVNSYDFEEKAYVKKDYWKDGRVESPSRRVSALRRRSLDLSAALADMRRR